MDSYADKPISWFAVGCYYYLIGNNESARKFFGRASQLDIHFGAAWIGFGHSFAAEGEHDQAMAAYCTSARCAACNSPAVSAAPSPLPSPANGANCTPLKYTVASAVLISAALHRVCGVWASRLMSGCHLPLLFIGMEYVVTNNPGMAQQYFTQAYAISGTKVQPLDPPPGIHRRRKRQPLLLILSSLDV